MKLVYRYILLLALTAVVSYGLSSTPAVLAQEASSSSYKVDEIFFGPGGSNDVSSTSYQGRASIGDTGIGNTSSTSNQSYGGFTTTTTPELEMTVAETNIDLGVLSNTETATASTTFTVRAYLASGYKVISVGNPPTSESGRQLSTSSSGTTSSAGTEFFGINLVDNSSPNIGANAVDDPVDIIDPQSNQVVETFGYGAPMYTFSRTNIFAYENGAEIAYSPSSTGKTTFTISYVYNISSTTPAGLYEFNQSLVVIGTY